jgi:thiol reductant ABC exporter CydD subunit
MRPFDPRLARDLKPVRGTIIFTTILHFVAALLVVTQSVVAAHVITNAFIWQWNLDRALPLLLLAAGAWSLRVILVSFNDAVARNYGLRAVSDVRQKTVAKLLKTPAHRLPLSAGKISTLLTRGIEGIEIYIARYLPQLVISAIVPASMVAVVFFLDPIAAVILVITLPLIPLFMVLVGWFTNDQVEKHWQRVLAVSGTLADLLNGLPELKVFGRAKAQANKIKELGETQKDATMKVLRLSFLSAMVLEFLATISVALIAVSIGLRLVYGEMELWRGLAALVIAPEVYAPLRMLGVHFHAATDGLEAWNRIKQLLDVESAEVGTKVIPVESPITIEWSELDVVVGDRILHLPSGSAAADFLAIAGPSGCGKSTLIDCMLGIRTPINGEIIYVSGGQRYPVTELDLAKLHNRIGYVSQNAWLGEGTVREVVCRGLGRLVSDSEINLLLNHLKLDLDLEIQISDRSQGVSLGQRRRLAVARALLRKPDILILDEPAAALDVETELAVVRELKKYANLGVTVVVVAHRESFISAADRVLDFKRVYA